MRAGRRVAGGLVVLAAGYAAVVAGSFLTVPRSDTDRTHFDTVIVLGTPAMADGSASPEETSRTLEGVREVKAGVADHMIVTGGRAHNRWVEAEVMAEVAERAGIPAGDVVVEGQAHDTIQNIYYSEKLMEARGWTSAEVVSSPSHLPRTALILEHWPGLQWRVHAAPWPPEYGWRDRWMRWYGEAMYCTKLRWVGFKKSAYMS